ncbi:DUF4129 domain-containing protein [Salipaludibacillus agaradhaerens]|uniref:DUF4129 domain-containing protein n=1 Tax=Salipaludibacillus agaradhaerens TaxID=76935 RepID=A0A9Q4B3F0_SALAG|nr:transglutaminaseTgpA domain-containing protein [Salipaludibacillus agaradhaerens]MCR6097619.1 DUF4129 domain-containing protein [Salipaludibacillus agaradhaerens]MCR6112897.1 DUF4129 domain-containing protein [Salipaludibacillus agaradhaerens]
MARITQNPIATVTHLVIYILTLLVMWEWLRPIPTITNTGEIHIFVWFTFLSATLIYLRVPYWTIVPVLFIVMLYGLHIIYYEGAFFSVEGGLSTVKLFFEDVTYNGGLIISRDFAFLTDPFRTFLLFFLLALICYLLYFWIFHARRIFFFLVTTVIYIAVLDTFTDVDASAAIVRIVVLGFFMLTFLQLLKVKEEEQKTGKRSGRYLSPVWMMTLVVMISVATVIGLVAPKPDPQWGDPVPAMREFVTGERHSNTGNRQVGYGENDEQLGGGFVQDDSVVFTAEIDEPVYWRGESKYNYTGHGWTADTVNIDMDLESSTPYGMFEARTFLESKEASVRMEEGTGFSHIFYPGQLQHVDENRLSITGDGSEASVNDISFSIDTVGGRIRAESSVYDDIIFTQYDLAYDAPTFTIDTLRDVSENDPEEIQQRYLQLPDELPERVGQLARDITAEEDTRYDKVVAIEQYFSQSGFTYQTEDVPIPEDGQDYVDQFLFETQRGYCDNYSTSMAVLLRTLDIPTRWVKGFTAGEQVGVVDEDTYLYEVTNGNAHSWVEVYFPEVGWVPFEPTQGFDNYADFEEEQLELERDFELNLENERDENDESDREDDQENVTPELEEGAEEGPTASENARNNDGILRDLLSPKAIIISLILLLAVAGVYRKQTQLQNWYFLFAYRVRGKQVKFDEAYTRLLTMLANEGVPQEAGETLREYAVRVDRLIGSQSMTKLTEAYEKIYYGGYKAEGTWAALQTEWEEVVKAISS